jgi:hypothetical protein
MVVEDIRVLIEGQTEEGAKVKLNRELIPLGYTGEFSLWVDLPSANNTVTVDVVDMAGNRNSTTINLLRKSQEEPEPQDLHLRPDYFPWAVLVAIVIIIVQFILLFRYSWLRSKKAQMEEGFEDEEEGLDEDDDFDEGPHGRKYPKRPVIKKGRTARKEPEFEEDEEYDEIDELEQQLDDEITLDGEEDEYELEVFDDEGGDVR